MVREAFSSEQWSHIRNTLREQFDISPAQGVQAWSDAYANALLGGDLEVCSRLTTERWRFPREFAQLVASHLRGGTEALREGRVNDALPLLAGGSTRGQDLLRPLLASNPQGDDRPSVGRATPVELKGAWLEAAGATLDAAESYHEAGKYYYWDNDSDAATSCLSQAIALNPRHVAAYWYLADVWLLRSYIPRPPYADRESVDRGIEVWEKGTALRLPDRLNSWAYVTRALLNDQLARLRDGQRVSLWWQAVVYLQRALVLNDTDASRWALLGRFHRLLENEASALHATREGIGRRDNDATALEERAAILANTGAFDEAGELIERRLAQDPNNAWVRGIKAYVALHNKQYAEALGLIDEVIAIDSQSLWNFDIQALCQLLLGDRAAARRTSEKIWNTFLSTPDPTADDRRVAAAAAYRLGQYDDAIAILERVVDEPVGRAYTRRALGFCYLAKGLLDRGEELVLSGLARSNSRELDDFLWGELAEPDLTGSSWRRTPGGEASLQRVKRTAAALAAELRRTGTQDPAAAAEAELRLALQAITGSEYDGWAEIALRAGLAHLQMQAERWLEAGTGYEALVGDRFPEATAAIRRVFQHLGDARWRANDEAEALRQYSRALAAAGGDDESRAALMARLGVVHQHQGDAGNARVSFLGALRLLQQTSPDVAWATLAAACRPLLRSTVDYWAIETHWQALQAEAARDEALSAALAQARASLRRYLEDLYGLARYSEPSAALPVTTPVALEVGSPLLPLVDPKIDNGKFINQDIAAMRDRIKTDIGLAVPGVRVRENVLLAEGYTILLSEVPVAQGAVRLGSHFCAAPIDELRAAGVEGEGVEPASDPVTGNKGAWCSQAHWDRLAANGLAHVSETDFILAHVANILRQHLAEFLGVEEAHALVVNLQSDPQHGGFAMQLAEDDASLLPFARVLRALVREQVPITNWAAVIETIQQRDVRNVADTVRDVRVRLRDQLPGNQPDVTRVPIPAEWETELAADTSGRANVSAANAHRWQTIVRQLVETRTGPIALVTASAEFRPLVRRLIESEFPAVSVLARDEVLDAARSVSGDALELGKATRQ